MKQAPRPGFQHAQLYVKEHGFGLHRSAFSDAIALRYSWEPLDLPTHCVCGESFNTSHALSCASGGFIVTGHNELGDFTADLLSEVCQEVEVEPKLHPLSENHILHASAIKNDDAWLDVKACRLWGGRFETAFFDVRIFNPSAVSNQTAS